MSRKTEVLLGYLAVIGRPQRRAALATVLWGNLLDEHANLSLRQSLRTAGHSCPSACA